MAMFNNQMEHFLPVGVGVYLINPIFQCSVSTDSHEMLRPKNLSAASFRSAESIWTMWMCLLKWALENTNNDGEKPS